MAKSSVASCVEFHGRTMILVPLLLQLHLLFLLNYYSTAAGGVQEHVLCIEKERDALLEFKASLYLPEYSWDTNNKTDCCEWEGVTCNKLSGHVQRLHLSGDVSYDEGFVPLYGEISVALIELQHLHYLNLSGNVFIGNLTPEFIGSLRNLRILDLRYSFLGGGTIPDSLATLSHLQYLDLSRNSLMGTIPHQLGNLSRLQYLDLSRNSLMGTIPHQLGNLSRLQYLDLSGNYFVGTIPHQLGSLSNLQELHLGFTEGGLKMDDNGGQWLSNLTLLTHLDLSGVHNLNHSHGTLKTIGKLSKLQQLGLAGCYLSDHNLLSLSHSWLNFSTSLDVLDLSGNTLTSPVIFQRVFNATPNLTNLDLSSNLLEDLIPFDFGKVANSLESLDLYGNKLQGGILKSLKDICTLRSLSLDNNNLNEDISSVLPNLSDCARYSLQELSLSDNIINGTLPDLSIFQSLKALDLSWNRLSGKLPDRLPPKLETLILYSNLLEGGIPKLFGNICTLRSLALSENSLSEEELPVIIHHLSIGCTKYSLQELHLSFNQITGTIPDLSIFHSLEELDLSYNLLNGKMPQNIGFPSHLKYLFMQFNNMEGVITDSHFSNTSMLRIVDFGYNSLDLIFSENWVPTFQLQGLYLSSCRIGPHFPQWLHTQKSLLRLDISNAQISDVVPMWFWAQMTKLLTVNISYNNLMGTIPNFPSRLSAYFAADMASNQFEGSIPPFLRSAASLFLSQNKFSEASALLCSNISADGLGILDLSKNELSGKLPDCWIQFKALEFLDLSANSLSGQVPSSMGSLFQLKVLILRNNSFNGKLPFSFKDCKNLVMIDVGENRLSGPIPSWLGIMGQQLRMLSFRKNNFSASLPHNLCYLTNLQLLDFSFNNLSGQILKCLKNFNSMSSLEGFSTGYVNTHYEVHIGGKFFGTSVFDLIPLLMWKGSEQLFKNNKLILKSIDLSSNHLTGDIPKEIGNLVELVSLNLSSNNLSGEIISEIGRLTSLDFLDLSRNNFFGSIPPSLAQIDRLSVLDLSYNNLSGRIPIGTQLQSFDASRYEGNADLCGKPLDKICLGDEEEPQDPKIVGKTSSEDKIPIYLSAALGFITGFWGLLGSLLLNRTWRHAYMLFLNNVIDTIYVITAVNVAKFQRWFRGLLEKFGKASPSG